MGSLTSQNAGAIVGNLQTPNFDNGTNAGANTVFHGGPTPNGSWSKVDLTLDVLGTMAMSSLSSAATAATSAQVLHADGSFGTVNLSAGINGILNPSSLSSAATAATSAQYFAADGFFKTLPTDVILVSTASIVASAAIVSISIPTAYDQVTINILGLYANSAQTLHMYCNGNSAGAYDECGFRQVANTAGAGSVTDLGRFSFTAFEVDADGGLISTSADAPGSLNITLNNPSGTSYKPLRASLWVGNKQGPFNTVLGEMAGMWKNTAAITTITLVPQGCLLMGGKIKVWGQKG